MIGTSNDRGEGLARRPGRPTGPTGHAKVVVKVRISEVAKDRSEELAKEAGIPWSEWMRRALDKAILGA